MLTKIAVVAANALHYPETGRSDYKINRVANNTMEGTGLQAPCHTVTNRTHKKGGTVEVPPPKRKKTMVSADPTS
jgi:hypothetical protein